MDSVSDKKQEKHGESLNTQRADNRADVGRLKGKIVEWYGGQEHGTPGFEKKEFDRLLADARKGKWDAVILNHADRWSRDNEKSKEGLRVLRDQNIKFFVRTFEQDLNNPTVRLYLGMSAEIGEYQAATQSQKSLVNRLNRAKEHGVPTAGGPMPYARSFNKVTKQWELDENKRALIEDAARRYLAGGSIKKIAAEIGMEHTRLHRILTKGSGDKWEIRFHSKDLNIDETVLFTIPRLLSDETIRRIHKTGRFQQDFHPRTT